MKVARVPAQVVILIGDGTEAKYTLPEGAVFFFPERKTEFNLLEMRQIIEEMEKMEKMEKNAWLISLKQFC